MTLSTIKHTGENGSDLYAVLSLSVLKSLNERQISDLKSIGIGSLAELLHYLPIHRARVIDAMARGEIAHELSLDGYIVSNYADRLAAQLIGDPLEAIMGIETRAAAVFANSFGVNTIGDLATFRPFLEAQRFLIPDDQVFNEPESAPRELVPRASGAVASSCSYSSFVREHWVAVEGVRVALNPVRQHYVDPLIAMLFVTEGHMDFGLGYVVRHNQRWLNMGTYLGEIQHSLGLAPGESRNIAVIDWKRSVVARRDEETQIQEQLNSTLVHKRALDEVTQAVAREHQAGSTGIDASTVATAVAGVAGGALIGGVAGAVGLGLAGAGIGALVGSAAGGGTLIGAGIGGAVGVAAGGTVGAAGGAVIGLGAVGAFNRQLGTIQTDSSGERQVAAGAQQNIAEMTKQMSSAVRSLWSTVVVSQEEAEAENVRTLNVTNYNHSHALTIQYYEVLQQYRVELELTDAEPLLFLPFKPLTFDIDLISLYWDKLRDAIPNRELAESFGSAIGHMQKVSFKQENIDKLKISRVTLKPRFTSELSSIEYILLVYESGSDLVRPNHDTWSFNKEYASPDRPNIDRLRSVNLVGNDRASTFDSDDGHKIEFDLIIELLLPESGEVIRVVKSMEERVKKREASVLLTDLKTWAKEKIQPLDARTTEAVLRVLRYVNERRYTFTRLLIKSIEREQLIDLIEALLITAPPVHNPASSVSLLSNPAEVDAGDGYDVSLAYTALVNSTWSVNRSEFRSKIIASRAAENVPLTNFMEREPFAIVDNTLIFRMRLPRQSTSLPDTLPPQLSAVREYPVALKAWFENYKKGQTARVDDVYLPTSGLFAEAILGRSNASEKIDLTRFYNWQDSPIPHLAPQINALTLASRARAVEGIEPTVPSGVLNIVNPHAMPDPVGLSAALGAVQHGQMFRDMSGRDELVQVLTNLSGLAEKTAGQAAQLTGDAAVETLKAATQLGTKVADIAAHIANTSAAIARDSMTSVGGVLNELGKMYGSVAASRADGATAGSGIGRSVSGNEGVGSASDAGNDALAPVSKIPSARAALPDSQRMRALGLDESFTPAEAREFVLVGSTGGAREERTVTSLEGAAPIINYTHPLNDERVQKVLDNIQERRADQASQRFLLDQYKAKYGFEILGFQQPWSHITRPDVEAVLLVSDTLGVAPEQVLSLWIHEGKYPSNDMLHDQNRHGFGTAFGAARLDAEATQHPNWGFARLGPWARSRILDHLFGLDYFTRRTLTAEQVKRIPIDEQPRVATRHFMAGIEELIALAKSDDWPELKDRTAEDVADYFTKPGGALGVKRMADDGDKVFIAIRKNSVPSWLYLQAALFLKYELDFLAMLGMDREEELDPWVTYWGFNGGVDFVSRTYFKGRDTRAVIRSIFHPEVAGNKPSPEEIQAYKDYRVNRLATDLYKVAKLNAIVHKYLVESVQPFFNRI